MSADVIKQLREACDDAEFFQSLGKLFTEQKLYTLARSAFEESLGLDPCDPFTHLYLGNWYYRERQLEAALERFEYANELMRDLPAPLWCIADVYEKMDRWDEAASFHRRAVAVDPDDRQAKRLYRRFRRRRRDREAGR